jgi:hypothetical protein
VELGVEGCVLDVAEDGGVSELGTDGGVSDAEGEIIMDRVVDN